MAIRATTVRDVMSHPVATVEPSDTLYVADERMAARGIRHLPVVDNGRVIGVLSQNDLIEQGTTSALGYATIGQKKLLRAIHAADAMTESVVTTSPETRVTEAALTLITRRLGCLPVTEGQTLVGIVTARDLLKGLVATADDTPAAADEWLIAAV